MTGNEAEGLLHLVVDLLEDNASSLPSYLSIFFVLCALTLTLHTFRALGGELVANW
jgi:hypothetical protein